MEYLADLVTFGVGVGIAISTTFKTYLSDETAKEQREATERWNNATHVPIRAYIYAFFTLLLFADCAADELGGHYERRGRDESEFVQDWKPTAAQRWQTHERLKNDRFVPVALGVASIDIWLRVRKKRREKAS